MLEIKQTDTYRKWERKLRDQRGKALIAARIFRLANGLAGDVKPVGQGVCELRIHHGPRTHRSGIWGSWLENIKNIQNYFNTLHKQTNK